MNTGPVQDADLREALRQLTRVLRTLHKALIDVETQYFGAVGGPLEHLQLVTNHPHFAWLQKFSGLMAELDEQLDQPEAITGAHAAAYRDALERLVGPQAADDVALRQKYNALLHDSPEVAMAHGALRVALQRLPTAAVPVEPQTPAP